MAKPTTHKLTGTTSNWKCTNCGGESGASNRGQADAFMGGSCISSQITTLTGGQDIRAFDGRVEVVAAPMATDRQINYIKKLTSTGHRSGSLPGPYDFDAMSHNMASSIIDSIKEEDM